MKDPESAPPRQIPEALLDRFTMGGRIEVVHRWRDDRPDPSLPRTYTHAAVEELLRRLGGRNGFYYGKTDRWLRAALERHPIRGLEVAVMGSETPLYESTCLVHGARPITIEYNAILCEDPRLRALTPSAWDRSGLVFEAALSISSFEHDGLGRYGDPVDPDGDLRAMERMKSGLIPGGVLFLSVPVGPDLLVWNLHRVYGRLRLPRLLSGWKVLEIHGHHGQPVFVLENSGSGEPDLGGYLSRVEWVDRFRRLLGRPGWRDPQESLP